MLLVPVRRPLSPHDVQNRPRRALQALTSAALLLSAGALPLTTTACSGGARADAHAPTSDSHAGALEWRPWGRESFTAARQGDRIILINVAAGWCHWCHVMDAETYGDPEIARLLREHFVTIRVDADSRPDIAERYLDWGWPATAMLTPDARPIMELRGFQKPEAFKELLRELIAAKQDGTLTGRRDPPDPEPADEDLEALRARVTAQLDRYYDQDQHGWGGPKKYPLAPAVEHSLLRAHLNDGTDDGQRWRARALASLAAETELIDPVWGGIYQYSVNNVWTRPHFEKLGGLQASSLESYARAYTITGDARWLAAAHSMRGYILGHLYEPDEHRFFTSQDADLTRPDHTSVPGTEYYAKPDAERRALGIPRIDRASYTNTNGQLIRALCRLYASAPPPVPTPNPKDAPAKDVEALEVATLVYAWLREHHRQPSGAFTHETAPQGELLHLADQAAIGRAQLELYRVTGERAYLDDARAVADFALAELQDHERGGFFAHTADPQAVGVFAERRRPLRDNGELARFLIDLHHLLDHDSEDLPYKPAAKRALTALSSPTIIKSWGRMVGEYLLALEALAYTPIDLTIVGDRDDPRAAALQRAALQLHEPRALLDYSEPGARYPDRGQPAVYLCTDTACSQPITDPAKLAEATRSFTANL